MRRAERAAEAEAHTLLDDERDALLDAVDAAETHYRWNWAQTAIEMLVEATTLGGIDSRPSRRRASSRGGGDEGEAKREKGRRRRREKATSFDRAQAKVRGESMSVRGASATARATVGGESGVNTSDERRGGWDKIE